MPRLRGRDPATVLFELSQRFERWKPSLSSLSILNAALNGYYLATGDVLYGVAHASCRLSGIHRTRFALGLSPTPLVWRGSSPAVNVVMLVVGSSRQPMDSVVVLGGLDRLVHDAAKLARLQAAETSASMMTVLREVEWQDATPPTSRAEGRRELTGVR